MRLSQNNLEYRYPGQKEALRFPDVTVDAGESLAITGPSGCGKSTWLQLLSGWIPVATGEVTVLGEDWRAIAPPDRDRIRGTRIGLVQQDLGLIPFLTVWQNLTIPLQLCGNHPEENRIRRLLQDLDVAELASRRPDHLSRGEQQRVAICRALVHKPDLVLADEPTASLDSEMTVRVCEILLRECDRLGAALVVATHDHEVSGAMTQHVEIVQ